MEVADTRTGVAVRDSQSPQGAMLRYSAESWLAFTGQTRKGRYDFTGR